MVESSKANKINLQFVSQYKNKINTEVSQFPFFSLDSEEPQSDFSNVIWIEMKKSIPKIEIGNYLYNYCDSRIVKDSQKSAYIEIINSKISLDQIMDILLKEYSHNIIKCLKHKDAPKYMARFHINHPDWLP